MGKTPEEILDQLELQLPELPPSTGRFARCVRTGNLAFLSGHGPIQDGQPVFLGKVGHQLTLEEAQDAARHVALSLLATLKHDIGDLDRVSRIVKLLVFVNSAPDFVDQHKVADSASELLHRVFGQHRGAHARSAIGAASLPFGFSVEIELVAEIADRPLGGDGEVT